MRIYKVDSEANIVEAKLSRIVHFSQFHHVGTASDILPGFVLGSCPLVG